MAILREIIDYLCLKAASNSSMCYNDFITENSECQVKIKHLGERVSKELAIDKSIEPLEICPKTGVQVYQEDHMKSIVGRMLGQGEFAEVYELKGKYSEYCLKFNNVSVDVELRNLLRFQHLAVPRVLGTMKGYETILMSRHQMSLKHWAQVMRPTKEQLLSVVVELAEILQEFHAGGYCHNHLHPDNVMIDLLPGGDPKVTVIDLGLMREIGVNPLPEWLVPNTVNPVRSYTSEATWFAPKILAGEGCTPNTDAISLAMSIIDLAYYGFLEVSSPFRQLLNWFADCHGDESGCCMKKLLVALKMEMDGCSSSQMEEWVEDQDGCSSSEMEEWVKELNRISSNCNCDEEEGKDCNQDDHVTAEELIVFPVNGGDTTQRKIESVPDGEISQISETETITSNSAEQNKIETSQEIILKQNEEISMMLKKNFLLQQELERQRKEKCHLVEKHVLELEEVHNYHEKQSGVADEMQCHLNSIITKLQRDLLQREQELASLRQQLALETREHDDLMLKMHLDVQTRESKYQKENAALRQVQAELRQDLFKALQRWDSSPTVGRTGVQKFSEYQREYEHKLQLMKHEWEKEKWEWECKMQQMLRDRENERWEMEHKLQQMKHEWEKEKWQWEHNMQQIIHEREKAQVDWTYEKNNMERDIQEMKKDLERRKLAREFLAQENVNEKQHLESQKEFSTKFIRGKIDSLEKEVKHLLDKQNELQAKNDLLLPVLMDFVVNQLGHKRKIRRRDPQNKKDLRTSKIKITQETEKAFLDEYFLDFFEAINQSSEGTSGGSLRRQHDPENTIDNFIRSLCELNVKWCRRRKNKKRRKAIVWPTWARPTPTPPRKERIRRALEKKRNRIRSLKERGISVTCTFCPCYKEFFGKICRIVENLFEGIMIEFKRHFKMKNPRNTNNKNKEQGKKENQPTSISKETLPNEMEELMRENKDLRGEIAHLRYQQEYLQRKRKKRELKRDHEIEHLKWLIEREKQLYIVLMELNEKKPYKGVRKLLQRMGWIPRKERIKNPNIEKLHKDRKKDPNLKKPKKNKNPKNKKDQGIKNPNIEKLHKDKKKDPNLKKQKKNKNPKNKKDQGTRKIKMTQKTEYLLDFFETINQSSEGTSGGSQRRQHDGEKTMDNFYRYLCELNVKKCHPRRAKQEKSGQKVKTKEVPCDGCSLPTPPKTPRKERRRRDKILSIKERVKAKCTFCSCFKKFFNNVCRLVWNLYTGIMIEIKRHFRIVKNPRIMLTCDTEDEVREWLERENEENQENIKNKNKEQTKKNKEQREEEKQPTPISKETLPKDMEELKRENKGLRKELAHLRYQQGNLQRKMLRREMKRNQEIKLLKRILDREQRLNNKVMGVCIELRHLKFRWLMKHMGWPFSRVENYGKRHGWI
ncbi:trichohyalin-like [Palaemon carinicauda]|uniref:trichohyalin-like n=1 Tax=Palaemon carinicauda TaxID=392227 RepID=UPI0035B66352